MKNSINIIVVNTFIDRRNVGYNDIFKLLLQVIDSKMYALHLRHRTRSRLKLSSIFVSF